MKKTNWGWAVRLMVVGLMVVGLAQDVLPQWNSGTPPAIGPTISITENAFGTLNFPNGGGNMRAGVYITGGNLTATNRSIGISTANGNITGGVIFNWSAYRSCNGADTAAVRLSGSGSGNVLNFNVVDNAIIAATSGHAIRATGSGPVHLRIVSGLVIAQGGNNIANVIQTAPSGSLRYDFPTAYIVSYEPGAYDCAEFKDGTKIHNYNLSVPAVSRPKWHVAEVNGEAVTGILYGDNQFFATTGVSFTHGASTNPAHPDSTKATCNSPMICTVCGAITAATNSANHVYETVEEGAPTCYSAVGTVTRCMHHHDEIRSSATIGERLTCHVITWETYGGQPPPTQRSVVARTEPNPYNSPTVISAPAPVTRDRFTFDGWSITTSTGPSVTFPIPNSQINGDVTLHAKWLAVTSGLSLTNANGGAALVNHVFPSAPFGYGAQTSLSVSIGNTGSLATGLITVPVLTGNASAFTVTRVTQSPANPSFTINSIDPFGSTAGAFTVTPTPGLPVGTYTATIAVNAADADVVNRSMTVSFTVTKASRSDTPSSDLVVSTPASFGQSDGTITGVDNTMQWRRTTVPITDWANVGSGVTTITGLIEGTYEVRFAENTTQLASPAIVITLGSSAATFPITVAATAGGTASANVTSAAEGTQITLTATPNTGYNFSGWTVNSGGITIEDNIFTMPENAVSITANFTPNNYSLTWNAGGGTPPPTQTTVNHGVNITEPEAMSKTGHTFGGWFTDGEFKISASFPITASEPMTFWAKWTLNNYAVKWNVDDGAPAPTQTTVNHGGQIDAPAEMLRTGHTFGGWFSNSGLTIPAVVFPVENVTEPTEFWAMWTINKYKVSFNSNGGSPVGDIDVDYNNRITAQPADPTLTGHTFDGWYRDAGLTNLWVFASNTVVSDTTLFAKWTPNKYTVTFNSNGGTAVLPTTDVSHGDKIGAPSAPTRAGHTFDKWYLDNGTFENEWVFADDNVTGNITLFANWNPAPLTGTAEISGNPVFGQTLTGSLVDGNNTGALTYTWKAGAGILQTGASATYVIAAAAVGQTITLEITSDVQTGGPITITMAAAVAKAPGPAAPTTPSLGQHVTVSSTNDGRIDGVNNTMEWRASGSSTYTEIAGSATTITGLDAGTYYVRVAATPTRLASLDGIAITIAQNYAITVNVGAGGGGTAVADVAFAIPGTTIILTPTPTQTNGVDSYTFVNWTSGVEITGNTFTMPSNAVTVTANFTPAALSGTAAIAGAAAVGGELTGSYTPGNNTGTLTYRWRAGAEVLGVGTTYTIKPADIGKVITLVIISSIQKDSVVSNPTAAVIPMPVTIIPNAGQQKVFGADDPTPFTFTTSPAGLETLVSGGSLGRAAGENAGTHAFTLGTLPAAAGSGYNLSLGGTATFEITKAVLPIDANHSRSVQYNDTEAQEKDLAVLVAEYNLPERTLTYSVESYTGASIFEAGAAVTDGTLSFKLLSGLPDASQTATIPVTIRGFANYQDFTVNVTVTLTSKIVAEVIVTAPASITYGGTLGNPSATSAGGDEFTYHYTGRLLDGLGGTPGTQYDLSENKPTLPGSYTVTAVLNSDTHAGEGSSNNFTISRKQLVWNDDGTVEDKDYDRTTAATVSSHPTLGGVINSDAVTVKTGTAAFVSRVVNSSAGVAASGYDMEGGAAWMYIVPASQPAFANAEIRPFEITITGVSATNRAWNVGTSVALTGGALVDVFSEDELNVGFTLGDGSITSASVENGKAVTTDIKLTGTEAGNYKLTQPTYVTVNIFRAENPSVPALDYSVSGDFPAKTVTITLVDGAEYSFDGGVTFSETNTHPSTQAEYIDLAIRFAQTATHNASDYVEGTVNTGNLPQATPAAFELSWDVRTAGVDYTVTIPVTEDADEYRFEIDGAEAQAWGTGNTIIALPGQTVTGYKRLAAKPGFSASASVSDEITLDLFTVETPTVSPDEDTYTTLSLTVTLSTTTADAEIYYTLDGSDPTTSSALYEEPFDLTASATVRAIAVKGGMTNSAVMNVTFTINTPTYAVTWNADGGTPAPDQPAVTHGNDIAEPEAMTKTGYIFGGWFSDEDFTAAVDFPVENVTAEKEFWAKWTVDPSIQIALDNAAIAAAKAAVEDAAYSDVPLMLLNTKDGAKAYVQEIIDALALSGVTAEIVDDGFTAAVEPTESDPDGEDGLYTFKVRLSKGLGEPAVTVELTLTVKAVSTPALAGIKFLSPRSGSNNDVPPHESIEDEDVLSLYTVKIAVVDQFGAIFEGGEPVRIDISVRIGNAVTTKIVYTDADGTARFKVSLAGSINGNEALFTARAQIEHETVRDTARLTIVRTVPAPAPAAAVIVTDTQDNAPDMDNITTAADEPFYAAKTQSDYFTESRFTAGPNVVKRGETVKIFREGKSIKDGALTVYDASGNPVGKISIRDGGVENFQPVQGIASESKRVVGSWNLKDTKGRFVSEGTYLIRGAAVTSDGKRERISLMISVR